MTIRVIATYDKAPAAQKDYPIDFGPFLQADEKVVGAVYAATPAGLTVGTGAYASTIAADGRSGVVWLLGGTPGISYEVLCTVTTDNVPPRVDSRTIVINVEQSGGSAVQFGPNEIDIVRDFGADRTGVLPADVSILLANDAAKFGQTITGPTGIYRLNLDHGTMNIQNGITFEGPSIGAGQLGPFVSNNAMAAAGYTGMTFYVYGTTVPAFSPNQQSTLRNIVGFYPEQERVTGGFTSYEDFIRVNAGEHGVTLENIIPVNAYNVISVGADGAVGGITIDGVRGTPLNRGIYLGRLSHTAKINNVDWNVANDYQNTAPFWADVQANSEGMRIAAAEAFKISNYFSGRLHMGIRFLLSGFDPRLSYGELVNGDFDLNDACVSIEDQALSTRGLVMTNCGLIPTTTGNGVLFQDTGGPVGFDAHPYVQAVNCRYWGVNSRCVHILAGSSGRYEQIGGSAVGSTNELFRNNSVVADAGLSLLNVTRANGVTVTGGAGTIVDVFDAAYHVI